MSLIGRTHLFSYNNLQAQQENTCGQAAIATIADFWNINPYNLKRVIKGQKNADDGKLHYENEKFVGLINRDYPPVYSPFPGITFAVTVRETLIKAFRHWGLKTDEGYPQALSDGKEAKQWLMEWIQKTNCPLIVLLDLKPFNWGYKDNLVLHWGIVHGYNDDGVMMASWHSNFPIPWKTFMEGWHCGYLPYPNNFYQLRVFK